MEKVNEQQDMSEKMMDAERSSFEAAYADSQGFEEKEHSLWFKKIGGEYEIAQVASAWIGWQKARASLPVGEPDGYALVPVEPTREMIEAALRSEDASFDSRSIAITDYRAMLAAAPTAKAEQVQRMRLVEMIDAAMVEMQNISPPLRRSECERLIRAALSTQQAAPERVSVPFRVANAIANGFVQEQGHAINELREMLAARGDL